MQFRKDLVLLLDWRELATIVALVSFLGTVAVWGVALRIVFN